ncbi:RHS repeat-associated core domain-containing protein [Pseudomonas sp. CAM1A]|uniref:RHS repeat-associated core domain-containing protein n=1 Tax=Pseudomonas sp. CAM1A TaxID=3231717 RepID=UPI0039C65E61
MATWQFCQLPALRSVARIACIPTAGSASTMSRARLRHPQSIPSILATDRQGSILLSNDQANRHTVYGDNRQSSARLGFTGQYCETNVGVYLLGNGYRHYNPRLMRFGSPDSFSPFGAGGINAYAYCGGDPVNRIDPSGHVPGSYTLYAGATSAGGKLKVISHGKSVSQGPGHKASKSFLNPWDAETNFFTENRYRAVVDNDPDSVNSIPNFVNGTRPVVQSYKSGAKVPNYELKELVRNKASTETISESERVAFRAPIQKMAEVHQVDVVLINSPITLEALLSSLRESDHMYSSVDCLHCRGSLSPRHPAVLKSVLSRIPT